MAKKRKKDRIEVPELAVRKPPDPTPTPVSTRNLERPAGSIRIVPGRKDAKS